MAVLVHSHAKNGGVAASAKLFQGQSTADSGSRPTVFNGSLRVVLSNEYGSQPVIRSFRAIELGREGSTHPIGHLQHVPGDFVGWRGQQKNKA
jgi:hypothetical protein